MDEDKREPVRLVYAGRRATVKGSLGYQYYEVTGLSELGEGRFYTRPLVAARVGTMILAQKDQRNAIYLGGDVAPQATGIWGDGGDILTWGAQEAADVTLVETQRTSKRLAQGAPEPVRDALDVLAQAYKGLAGVGRRAAFLAYVTTAISDR
jgi:hypothetical protein